MNAYTVSSQIICGSIISLRNLLPDLQNPILILSSPSVINIPTVQQFVSLLHQDFSLEIFSNILPNAPFSSVDKAIEAGRKINPKTIIAIGGGSVLDASKAIAFTLSTNLSYKDYFNQSKKPPARNISLIAVPTTAGTGAELSFGAILYDEENNIKSGIRGTSLQPDIVLLDFSLYTHASSKLIAEVGFDCLTHAVETYISSASTPIVRYQSIAAIETVFHNLRQAVQRDPLAMERMAIASTMMGLNLALSSTCLPHRIQYVIGPKTSTSHAQGLIALYTGWLSVIGAQRSGPFAELCRELSMEQDIFISKVTQLKKDLTIEYTLTEFGIKKNDIPGLAGMVGGNLSNDPYYLNVETIAEILEKSL